MGLRAPFTLCAINLVVRTTDAQPAGRGESTQKGAFPAASPCPNSLFAICEVVAY
jgi:hypothetical protein